MVAAAGERAPVDLGCVACDFVDAALRRRIFFTLVEGLGEYWFARAMEDSGFCVRHARGVIAAGGGPGLTAALLEVLAGWSRRFDDAARPDPRVGHACYLCDTEAWAERFAIGLLTGPDDAYALAQLGRLEPLCLRHSRGVLERASWSRVPPAARALDQRRRTADALAAANPPDAILATTGRDPNAVARPRVESGRLESSDGEAVPADDRREGWAAGSLSMRGLHLELAAGRCPACSAAGAAARTHLRWLGSGESAERVRDRDLLCAEHLHDARHHAPTAAARAMAASVEGWARAGGVLATLEAPPPRELLARVRTAPAVARAAWASATETRRATRAAGAVVDYLARPGRAAIATRDVALRQRTTPCVACQAMLTATSRTIDLLGALLAGSAGVRFYEETAGLCLRHVARALAQLEGHPAEREILRARARARAREVRWELEEWIRKSSWSVRYEPAGPEASAWRRGMVLVLGEDVQATDLLATEPEAPRPAA